MPSATPPHPERSQLARASAIGSAFSGRGDCEDTPLHTATARPRPVFSPSAECQRSAAGSTADSTARVDSRLPTVIRTLPSA